MEWLYHIVILRLISGVTTILFSMAAVPFSIPISDAQGFLLLHIFTNQEAFIILAIIVDLHRNLVMVLITLRMILIFLSCAYW